MYVKGVMAGGRGFLRIGGSYLDLRTPFIQLSFCFLMKRMLDLLLLISPKI